MAGGHERESPRRELTSKEQGGVNKEVAANALLAPLTEEQQGWNERPHEELVKVFKDYVQEQIQETGGAYSPEEIICLRLDSFPIEVSGLYLPLIYAWDALAHNGYERGSMFEHYAGLGLTDYCQRTKESTIKLSAPQIRIINALTEAVGIQHERGQAVIEIPNKFRDYGEWLSKEHYDRVARARSRRNRR